MSVQQRNNVNISGDGPITLIFAHGFGCDQNMWRFMAPHFAARFKVVLFDLVGNGNSDVSAWYPHKYSSLKGYATDLLEVVNEFAAEGPVVHVGHSVSCMIAVLAELQSPGRFDGHIMIGPSPHYLNEGDYMGDSLAPMWIRCLRRWKAITLAGRAPWRPHSWAPRTGLN